MKKLMTTAAIVLALGAAPAMATGWGNKTYNTGGSGGAGGAGGKGGSAYAVGKGGNATQGQAQGQIQGQAQGQKQKASARATGGSASNAGNAQNLSINSKSTYNEAAYSPDVNVSDCQVGLSAGVPGAVAGIGIPGKHCRVLIEAELIEYHWGKEAAGQHLYDNNPRIRRTINKQITSQQPVSKVSTRNRVASAPTAMRGEDR